MACWVTMRDGRVLKYNECGSYDFDGSWVVLRSCREDKAKGLVISRLRNESVESLEFSQPCEVTWTDDVVRRSIEILLVHAKAITDTQRKRKLADLARQLRKFNPQRMVWSKS